MKPTPFKHYYVLHDGAKYFSSTNIASVNNIPIMYRYYPNMKELDIFETNRTIARGSKEIRNILPAQVYNIECDACTIIDFENEEDYILAKLTNCFGLDKIYV